MKTLEISSATRTGKASKIKGFATTGFFPLTIFAMLSIVDVYRAPARFWKPGKSHRIKMRNIETLAKSGDFKLIETKFIKIAGLVI